MDIDNKDNKNNVEIKSFQTWDELDCDMTLLRGIYAYGFETPSPIQQKAIIPMMSKKDIIAQAQSGTGKTGCFAVGMLQSIDLNKNDIQVLCISPTRELSIQIKEVIDGIGSMMSGLKTHLLVGGTSINEDISVLNNNKKPHIVIGCPGRIYDMICRKKFNTKKLKMLVIDEADELLSQGFMEQIYNIFMNLPQDIQVCLFSATIPNELYKITDKFMRDPIKILVKNESLTLEGILQYYVALEKEEHKYETIKDFFKYINLSYCIIYCNSVKKVEELYKNMCDEGFSVCMVHSNMQHKERIENYNSFKSGYKRVLISSNVTARGIDIQQLGIVINYDLPNCVHTYLHRIGRSGRWGRKGLGINLITNNDYKKLKEIENYYKTEINEMPMDVFDKL